MNVRKNTRPAFLGALIAAMTLLLSSAASAQAAPEAAWRIDSQADTTAVPGGTITYHLQVTNVGSEDADGIHPVITTVSLPTGLSGVSAGGFEPSTSNLECTGDGTDLSDPTGVLGATTIECATPNHVPAHQNVVSQLWYTIVIKVGEGVTVPTILTTAIHVAGGGPAEPSASSADPTRIESPPPFGIDAFDAGMAADAQGNPSTEAAGHPDSSGANFDFNTITSPLPLQGELWPVEPTRDVVVDLPPGAVGAPVGVKQCTAGQLANGGGLEARSLCPEASQVGTTLIHFNGQEHFSSAFGPLPVFNMVPPPGVPARFGFDILGTVVLLDAHLRSSGDYGLSIISRQVSEGLQLQGVGTTFWGNPADASHTPERACTNHVAPALGGPPCPNPNETEPSAFLRNPTSCTGPMTSALHIDSWTHPGTYDANGEPKLGEAAWQSATSVSHQLPGYPYPPEDRGAAVGMGECGNVPFTPHISVQPTTNKADSATGLNVDLEMPQQCFEANHAEETCQADVKDSTVTQPVGTRVNPATAAGLTGCSDAQIGLITTAGAMPNPIRFSEAPPSCPDSSKIGTVEIESPLLEDKLEGSIYQAKQNENPFGSTLAFYTVASADGVMIKLPAEVKTDPGTGQVTTVFKDNPQLPFRHYRLHFFGGEHAPLITPPTCGKFTTHSSFTGWANPGEAAQLEDSFEITQGANGGACPNGEGGRPFAPTFEAGTANPLAGSYSPFVLKLHREDGMQEFSGLSTTLPPGLIGKLAGVPYCPEAAIAAASAARGLAEQAAPSCPAASQIGISDALAGAGPAPFHNPGKVYLAGPYKGAPLSIVIVTPAVAGPLDLGTVAVRAALQVDPTTTQINVVSDPIPTILRERGDGFPLDLRTIYVAIDRPSFTLNPTSCDPMAVTGTASALQGASAALNYHFQAAGCDKLGFKPKLSFRLKGTTKRGGNPRFSATLTMPPGGANIARAQVSLPHSEFLDQSHIKTICTRVQFAANQCPAKSVYGFAKAVTPLLDKPLEGPVYLRSSSHNLPDLVADLNGQIHVVLDGRIDSHNKGIRNTFEVVPDAPVSAFTLTMQGGAKGLLQNSRNLCKSPSKVSVEFDAQNGKVADSTPPLVAASCGGARRKSGGHPPGGRR